MKSASQSSELLLKGLQQAVDHPEQRDSPSLPVTSPAVSSMNAKTPVQTRTLRPVQGSTCSNKLLPAFPAAVFPFETQGRSCPWRLSAPVVTGRYAAQ